MKKIFIILTVMLIVGFGVYFSVTDKEKSTNTPTEQAVIETTYNIATKYVSLRTQTENVLVNPKSFSNYEAWNAEVTHILQGWKEIDVESALLETSATDMAEETVGFQLIAPALAYDNQEISTIFDKAPAGKKIATLAKFLNTDAKKAFKILQQDQNQVTADAWNEAGNSLKELETSATVLKDACKVTVTIGTVVATGGIAAVTSASTLTQAAVIVSGADVVLEVSSDAAKITLGDSNKISNVIDSARIVTEPIATMLTISSLPQNIGTKFEKFGAVMVGLEQFNAAAQEGKIIGIAVTPPADGTTQKTVSVAVLEKTELQQWIESQATKPVTDIKEDKTGEGNSAAPSSEVTSTDSPYLSGNFDLVMKPQEPSNDWQNIISQKLIAGNPINVREGKFLSEYNTPLTVGDFVGTGSMRLEGEYDEKTGVIKGTHYLKYDGTYKGKSRSVAYSGTFNQVISAQGENKLNLMGAIETMSLDGLGKPYTTTSEGGRTVIYIIKK